MDLIYDLTIPLLWVCIVGCGLIGGLFFSFSTFIMRALDSIDRPAGIAAMNAINAVILRSLFMAVFLGTTLVAFVLAIIGFFFWAGPGGAALAAGGVIYVLGVFGVTMWKNVPLNNQLARLATSDLWSRYMRDWVIWNHVRTISSIAATTLFVFGLTETI